jgi:hypothetical protein
MNKTERVFLTIITLCLLGLIFSLGGLTGSLTGTQYVERNGCRSACKRRGGSEYAVEGQVCVCDKRLVLKLDHGAMWTPRYVGE